MKMFEHSFIANSNRLSINRRMKIFETSFEHERCEGDIIHDQENGRVQKL